MKSQENSAPVDAGPTEQEITQLEMAQLDMRISRALNGTEKWLEVKPELITYLMKGMPWTDSILYRNVELFAQGTRSEVLRKRGLTSEEINHQKQV